EDDDEDEDEDEDDDEDDEDEDDEDEDDEDEDDDEEDDDERGRLVSDRLEAAVESLAAHSARRERGAADDGELAGAASGQYADDPAEVVDPSDPDDAGAPLAEMIQLRRSESS